MRQTPYPLALTLLCATLSACSSTPEQPEPQGFLATHIEDDNSKLFVYSLEMPSPEQARRGSKGNGRPGNATGQVYGSSSRGMAGGVTVGSGGGRRAASNHSGTGRGTSRGTSRSQGNINGRLENMLAEELEQSGYCRNGFMELERMTQPPDVFIKGECDESATEEDRNLFPNNAD